MKIIKVLILLFVLFILLGCVDNSDENIDNQKKPTNDEFWSNTTITDIILDADFVDIEAADNFANNYSFHNMSYVRVEDFHDLVTIIDSMDFTVDEEKVSFTTNECEEDYCSYFIVPVYNTWFFDKYELDYLYLDGTISFELTTESSNFPQSTIKVLILKVDSEFPFEIDINSSMKDD